MSSVDKVTQVDNVVVTIKDLIGEMREESPELFSGIPESRIIRLARLFTAKIAERVENVEKGVVRVPNLGSFNIRHVVIGNGDEKAHSRRVIFRAKLVDKDE